MHQATGQKGGRHSPTPIPRNARVQPSVATQSQLALNAIRGQETHLDKKSTAWRKMSCGVATHFLRHDIGTKVGSLSPLLIPPSFRFLPSAMLQEKQEYLRDHSRRAQYNTIYGEEDWWTTNSNASLDFCSAALLCATYSSQVARVPRVACARAAAWAYRSPPFIFVVTCVTGGSPGHSAAGASCLHQLWVWTIAVLIQQDVQSFLIYSCLWKLNLYLKNKKEKEGLTQYLKHDCIVLQCMQSSRRHSS